MQGYRFSRPVPFDQMTALPVPFDQMTALLTQGTKG
jgi:EAL domain-containing protein (putative c-di-GMP-specific phosphodiesterase class I)